MGGRRKKGLELKQGIYIVGEGITEQYYFSHLKQLKNYNCEVKPRFFGKTNIFEIEKSIEKLLSGDITVICVFDADVSERNMVEKEKLQKFIRKYKNNPNVIICDSLPSIEFWFLLHFKKTNKTFQNGKAINKELLVFIKDYEKTEDYLKKLAWVEQLVEIQDNACNNAKIIGQVEGNSYSNIYMGIDRLDNIR